ncbi:hypothetical protein [Pseudomonas sp.]|uniref:hypothetical protein n=1 Tax=Pseudomonas sp. TaxID=306 RepID=UPI00262EEC86|nr:hypothetical protein [Pseudomonas sp.]
MTRPDGSFPGEVVRLMWGRAFASCESCGRGLVWERRGWQWSAHHRDPRGMGGSSDPALGAASNGLILCGHGTSGCHGLVESRRAAALAAGLLVGPGARAADVPVTLYMFGRVRLLDSGLVSDV